MHRVLNRRAACFAAVLACAGSLLQGCYIPDHHPAFGAEDMKRVEDNFGRPTYSMEGRTFYGLDPSRDASKVMLAACPNGHPRLLSGNAFGFKGQSAEGIPSSGVFWYATFSCDQVIPLK
jgi:hypothetical protein